MSSKRKQTYRIKAQYGKKRDIFANIVARIKKRTISWSSKLFSRAGKLIMLRSVLSAMPAHAMSCFKLPQSLCAQIQSLLTRFWWDSAQDKRRIAWVSWAKITKPKKHGGLGLKDIATFNDAMLAKLSWRILKNPQCLLARCLLGKYCKEDSFLSIKPSKSSSHGWRGVLIGRDLLAKQLGWIVGTGADISIWNDPWLSSTEQLRPYGPAPEHLQDLKVSDLMRPDSTEWDTQALDLFLPCYKASIFLIKPSVCNAPNELVWLKTASGVYSTKSGYHAQSETSTQEEPTDPANTIDWLACVWNLKTAEKIKLFLWSALHNGLPVGEQLSIRNIPIQNRCPRCNEMESVTHMLFHCTFVKDDWESAPLSSPVIPALLQNSGEALSLLRRIPSLPPVGLGPGSLQAWICWNIWISRNQLIFQKRSFSPAETLLKAIQEAREWTLAQAPTPLSPNRRSSIAFDPSTELFRTCMFTDAAWNPLTKSAGFGWIIDDAGSSSSHSAASLSVASPLVAEAMALRSAMISALNGGFNALHVFSDSQILINLVISKQRNLEIAVILTDIYLLIPLFHVIKFKAIHYKKIVILQ